MSERDAFQEQLAGFVLAIGSLVMTAIFPVFSKIKVVKDCNINPLVFNLYFQCGVILFCIITTISVSFFGSTTLHFSYYGMISGILLGVGGWLIWLSLTYVGITHTSAIASGVASITGFIEGIFIGNYPDHVPLSLFALFLIVIGILGIGFNEALTSFIMQRFCCHSDQDTVQILPPEGFDDITYDEHQPQTLFRFAANPYALAPADDDDDRENDRNMDEYDSEEELLPAHLRQTGTTPTQLRLTGIGFSFLAGICFGSMSYPEEFTTSDTTEAYFLPSFGVGIILMMILDLCVLSMMNSEQSWHFAQCFVPGLASGSVWGIGFLCILYAELLISYSMAIPIRECSICLAVLIGIFGFGEITDSRAIVITLMCVSIVVIGCFLLPLGIE